MVYAEHLSFFWEYGILDVYLISCEYNLWGLSL